MKRIKTILVSILFMITSMLFLAGCSKKYKITLEPKDAFEYNTKIDLNKVKKNTELELTIKVPEKKEVESFKVDDTDKTSELKDNKYKLKVVNNHTVSVRFKDEGSVSCYELKLPEGVSLKDATLDINKIPNGTNTTLVLDYDDSTKQIKTFKVNDVEQKDKVINKEYTFKITKDTTVIFETEDIIYKPGETVSLTLPEGVKSDQKDNTKIKKGTRVTLTLQYERNEGVKTFTVNGVDKSDELKSNLLYIFEINENTTVKFEKAKVFKLKINQSGIEFQVKDENGNILEEENPHGSFSISVFENSKLEVLFYLYNYQIKALMVNDVDKISDLVNGNTYNLDVKEDTEISVELKDYKPNPDKTFSLELPEGFEVEEPKGLDLNKIKDGTELSIKFLFNPYHEFIKEFNINTFLVSQYEIYPHTQQQEYFTFGVFIRENTKITFEKVNVVRLKLEDRNNFNVLTKPLKDHMGDFMFEKDSKVKLEVVNLRKGEEVSSLKVNDKEMISNLKDNILELTLNEDNEIKIEFSGPYYKLELDGDITTTVKDLNKVSFNELVSLNLNLGEGEVIETFTVNGIDRKDNVSGNKYLLFIKEDTKVSLTKKEISHKLEGDTEKVDIEPKDLDINNIPHGKEVKLKVKDLGDKRLVKVLLNGKTIKKDASDYYSFVVTCDLKLEVITSEKDSFKVSFYDLYGQLIKEKEVKKDSPCDTSDIKAPEYAYNKFKSWSENLGSITSDMIVYPVYETDTNAYSVNSDKTYTDFHNFTVVKQNLKVLVIPDKVDGKPVKGIYSIINGDNLEVIYFGEGVEGLNDVDPNSYNNFPKNLKNIAISSKNPKLFTEDQVIFRKTNSDGKEIYIYPTYKQDETYIVPSDVLGIKYIKHNKYLKELDLTKTEKNILWQFESESLEVIHFNKLESINGVFSLSNPIKTLKTVTIKDQEYSKVIDGVVYYEGSLLFVPARLELKHLIIPDNIKKIENFIYNETIEKITIPRNFDPDGVISGFENLKEIVLEDGNENLLLYEGVLYKKGYSYQAMGTEFSIVLFPSGREEENYTVPSFVNILDLDSISFKNIKSITIKNGQKIIPDKPYDRPFSQNIEKIIIDGEHDDYITKNGALFSKKEGKLIYYPAGKKDKEVTFDFLTEYEAVYKNKNIEILKIDASNFGGNKFDIDDKITKQLPNLKELHLIGKFTDFNFGYIDGEKIEKFYVSQEMKDEILKSQYILGVIGGADKIFVLP